MSSTGNVSNAAPQARSAAGAGALARASIGSTLRCLA
jgi:hypothetical protein